MDFSLDRQDHQIRGYIRIPDSDRGLKVPLAIFMHGATMHKNSMPLRALSDDLTDQGIAVLWFDFYGHGETGGDIESMTVDKWVEDADAVLSYARSLPFVSDIFLVGHSQGGLAASLLAGRYPDWIKAMVLYAPAAVIEDIGKTGKMAGAAFDPDHVPQWLPFFGGRIRGDFFSRARDLHVYETAGSYRGPVCILQGTADPLVPVSYAHKYHKIYKDSKLVLFDGDDHVFHKNRQEAAKIGKDFLLRCHQPA